MKNRTYLSAAALLWAAVWLLASGPAESGMQPKPIAPAAQAQQIESAPSPATLLEAVPVPEAIGSVMAPGAPISR
ncbi:MAG: hypothetical protein HY922_13715 [Elusimicrobia bacterium]|nr:hypothetical protein [Elusimicrobiota bacterium]